MRSTKSTGIGLNKNRILWITSKYVLSLKRDKDRLDNKGNPDLTGLWLKRIIKVSNLGGVTKSLHEKSFEFIIHIPNEYDYRYSAMSERNREEIISALKLAVLSTWKRDLIVYGVPNKFLGKYTKTSSGINRNSKLPDDKYILQDELINMDNFKSSIGPNSTPDRETNIIDDEFELIDEYMEGPKKKHSKIKKSKSAESKLLQADNYTAELVNEIKTKDKDESSDEELKLQDDINNDDAEITFDLNDEEFDIFGERGETVYSKHEGTSKLIKAQDFTLKRLLRTTETGKVYLAELNDDGKWYAMKSINKDQFIKRFKSLKIERELKSQLHHPFISSLEFVFQNDYRIYLVSELLRGGDLESLIKKEGNLKEDQIKFYTTQLVLVLGFLHSNGIVYRNLKASNVLINSDGYIKLGDFDYWGRVTKFDLSNSFWRLVEYQAPEVIANKGHDHTIDWWALGILMNQMIGWDNNSDNSSDCTFDTDQKYRKYSKKSWLSDSFMKIAKDLIQ